MRLLLPLNARRAVSREFWFFLEDMKKACDKVSRFTLGLNRIQFFADEKTADAVMRNLEIIGEAAKHIPEDIRRQYPDIPWRKIAGFRDVAIHEYFGIDSDVIWDIITNEIPGLSKDLEKILRDRKT